MPSLWRHRARTQLNLHQSLPGNQLIKPLPNSTLDTTRGLPRRERRKIGIAKKATALALAGLMLGSGAATFGQAILPVISAQALSNGPGNLYGNTMHMGGYLHANGTVLYCLELGKAPDDSNAAPALHQMDTIPAYQASWFVQQGVYYYNIGAGALTKDSSQYQRISYLLGKYGQTQNGNQAAALALAVWDIRGEVGKTGDYDKLMQANKDLAGSTVVSLLNNMKAEAANYLAAGGDGGGVTSQPGAPSVVGTESYSGVLNVKAGTSEIALTNATFSDGTSKKIWSGGLDSDITLNWVGQPPAGDYDRYYTVSVNGKYVYEVSKPGLIYATHGDPWNQSTGHANQPVYEKHTGDFATSYIDPDTLWAPQLSTQVPAEFVEKGENFGDTVTFFADPDLAEWRWQALSNGGKRYAPITAVGTLYGPFVDDPALNPQGAAPEGAPVVGTASVTTDVATGPGTYSVAVDLVATESGYYSWVWDINYEDQIAGVINPVTGESSIPENYFFTDGFGQATEGQTVPMNVEISTEISHSQRKAGETFSDDVTVTLEEGEWLNGQDGNPIPLKLRGTVYTMPDTTPQSATAPAEAKQGATVYATANGEGTVTVDNIVVPDHEDHYWATIQWCALPEDQPNGLGNYFVETCDDFGVPSESLRVVKPWAPELSTNTPVKFVSKGDEASDMVTFQAQEAAGLGRWGQYKDLNTGEQVYDVVKAQGTFYGPFLQDPALNPQSTVPKGSRVAGTATVSTTPDLGPGVFVVEDTDIIFEENGFYTWVWGIEFDDQSQTTKDSGLEASRLPFYDRFGDENEGQTMRMDSEITTKLSAGKAPIGEILSDEVQFEILDGGWLQGEDGERLPVRLRGEVYAAPEKLEQQPEAPEEATLHQTLWADFTGPNQVNLVEGIKIPATTDNWLTVQWCLVPEKQNTISRDYFEYSCDDFGVPAESADIEKPEVTTQAQEEAPIYGTMKDTAKVTGKLPVGDMKTSVDFTAYLKPEAGEPKYDENWNKVLDENGDVVLWTEDEVSDPAAVCKAQPVATTDRVEVTKTGSYDSPEVTTKSTGTIYWVEKLFVEDPKKGEEVLLHEGECGIPNETTYITPPTVTTQAQEVGAVKGDIHDVAFVEGLTPDAPTTVDFTLFLKPEVGQPKYDENWNEVLDENGDVVLWTEDEVADPAAVCEAQPVAKTDRVEVDGAGEYTSPAVRAETEGTGYWVEELFVEDPETGEEISLHRGECGLPNETTVIERPTVTTKAVDEAKVGDKIFDTAIVDGPLSEREEISYEVSFEAYHRAAEDGPTTEIDEALCTVDTMVWETDKATPVTTAGEYRSEEWKLEESHIGEILWVETLWEIEQSDEGEIRSEIHRGACGEENEITKVNEKPELAFTGSAFGNSALVAGLLLLLVGGGLAFVHRRKPEASILD